MIELRDYDVLGIFVAPASVCFAAALVASLMLRRLLDRTAINRFVWNRALFDLSLLVAMTSLLILTLRTPGS